MPADLALHDGHGHAHAGIAGCILIAVSCRIAAAAGRSRAPRQQLAFLTTEAQSVFQSSGAGAPPHLALLERYRRAHAADAGHFLVAVSSEAANASSASPPALAGRKTARPWPLTLPSSFVEIVRPRPTGYFFGQGVGATFGFPDPGGLPGLFPVPAPAPWDDLFATTW